MINFLGRLTVRDRYIGLAPTFFVLLTSIWVLMNGGESGMQPRAGIFDAYMKFLPREASSSHLDRYAIIDIDGQSLDRVAPWPWPRTALSNLIMAATDAGARSVILTIPVSGQDPLSPEAVGQYWFDTSFTDQSVSGISTLSELVRALPSTDVSLARALSNMPTSVTASAPSSPIKTKLVPASRIQAFLSSRDIPDANISSADTRGVKISTGKTADGERAGSQIPKNVTLYAVPDPEAISTIIQTNSVRSVPALLKDRDRIARHAPLFFLEGNDVIPASSVAPLIPPLGTDVLTLTYSTDPLITAFGGSPARTISLNDKRISLDPAGALIFYPPANTNIETIPAWRIFGGSEIWTGLLRDKIVYVNLNHDGKDTVQTAFGPLSSAAFHVLVSDQLASGVSIKRAFWMPFLEAVIAGIAGVFVITLCLSGMVRIGLAVAGGIAAVSIVTSWILFSTQSLLVDPAAPVLTMLVALVTLPLSQTAFLFLDGDKARLYFHGAFPTAALSMLQRERNADLLRAQNHQVTVLSAAISFPHSQAAIIAQSPDTYVKFMAMISHAIQKSVLSFGGAVDWAEGAVILGYWNTPIRSGDHIERACTCALQLIEDISSITADFQTAQFVQKKRRSPAEAGLDIGQARLEIGLVSAPAISGALGAAPYNRFTVIGESVAYARIIRQRSRLYGPAIICDESIYREMRHHLAFLDLDTINLAGSPSPRSLYGLVGNPFLKASRGFREISELQQSLTDSWHNRQSKAAAEALEKLRGFPGTHDSFIELYQYRLNRLKGKSSPEEEKKFAWDNERPIVL